MLKRLGKCSLIFRTPPVACWYENCCKLEPHRWKSQPHIHVWPNPASRYGEQSILIWPFKCCLYGINEVFMINTTLENHISRKLLEFADIRFKALSYSKWQSLGSRLSQFWNHRITESFRFGGMSGGLLVQPSKTKYKFCKSALEFCKIFSWAVIGDRTENILCCMWKGALVLKNYPWEASLRDLGIKLSNSWLLKEMRKSNIVLQIFPSL